MRRNQIIIAFCFLAVTAALAWWLLRASKHAPVEASSLPIVGVSPSSATASSSASATPEPINERRQATIASIVSALSTPIAFYGKVVDQNGDPVANATAKYNVIDKFDASGSNYQSESDANGSFSISGINGAVLLVGVNKDKYYQIDGKSGGAFAYGVGPDSTRKLPPTKEHPAIFVLHKMGNTVPLIYVGTCYYKVSKDGQPVDVDLKTGKQVAAGQGDLRFERWANDKIKDERGHFDWRLRIAVLDGGIIERKDQFAFEAPEEGYQNAIEIDMPASLGDKWNYTVGESYFIKMSDGHYARINITIQSGHNNTPLVVDSFVNPEIGDRNLEYDPNKVVKPK